ncbi:MAG: glycoside hydrolase family 130 protein [Christiangramia sp.]|uniref:glycoside hydrolase family 130 protein n=1 Tax=Christiangramia sp. TaxID=1931228 RepID=UPI003242D017
MKIQKMTRNLLLFAFVLASLQTLNAQDSLKTWMLGPFFRSEDPKPISQSDPESSFKDPITGDVAYWKSMATFNPAAIVKNGKVQVFYRAEEKLGEKEIGGHRSRIGLMTSEDGVNFQKNKQPVFYPDNDSQKANEWPGGTEDPRLVQTEEGLFVLTYTQWNRKVPKLAVATSKDLINWDKHGPVFQNYKDGSYHEQETKSGAIVTKLENGRLVATKINGKYWMYYGVPTINLAYSEDLINWIPLEDFEGKAAAVLKPRTGYFDSWLVEAGPPPVLTKDGIVVLYNAGNSRNIGQQDLANRIYTGGQALFSATEPWKLLDRSAKPFIQPETDFEKSGQYQDGTTFIEGLVYFQQKWFLYYGTADSMIGVVSTK